MLEKSGAIPADAGADKSITKQNDLKRGRESGNLGVVEAVMKVATIKSVCMVGLVAVLALGPNALQSSVHKAEKSNYLLKVSNTAEAVQLVEAVGGAVFETIETMNYIGVSLSGQQLDLISRSANVLRISPAGEVESFDSGLGGIAELQAESGEDMVAGKLWNRNSWRRR